MTITLIGYRGCGKSTIAPALAARLGCEWIDADIELERRAGRSIREIFATDGEAVFREIEHQTLTELLQRDRIVVAAGGGAILREDNGRAMRTAGPVVWLSAPVDVLCGRILGDPTTAARRPNLTAAGGRIEVEQLLAVREPLYRAAATLIVDAGDRPVEEIVDEIVRGLEKRV